MSGWPHWYIWFATPRWTTLGIGLRRSPRVRALTSRRGTGKASWPLFGPAAGRGHLVLPSSALCAPRRRSPPGPVPVKVDPDLTEWAVIGRWKGHAWRDILPRSRELEAYLERPESLPFAGETLEALAERMAAVARRLDSEHPHGDVVIVSHQDPIQAGILRLVGSPLARLQQEKPGHGTVVTLRPGPAWRVETVWEPGESPRFGEKRGLRVLEHAGSRTARFCLTPSPAKLWPVTVPVLACTPLVAALLWASRWERTAGPSPRARSSSSSPACSD